MRPPNGNTPKARPFLWVLDLKMLRRGRLGGWMDSLRQTIAQHGLHTSQATKSKQLVSTGKKKNRHFLSYLVDFLSYWEYLI